MNCSFDKAERKREYSHQVYTLHPYKYFHGFFYQYKYTYPLNVALLLPIFLLGIILMLAHRFALLFTN